MDSDSAVRVIAVLVGLLLVALAWGLVLSRGFEAELSARVEVVHHEDGDKQNNALDNLWLTDQVGHRQAHASLQDIGYLLYKAGLIGFDRELGVYFIKDKAFRDEVYERIARQSPVEEVPGS